MRLFIFETAQADPYENLAAEEHLLSVCGQENSAALFLWQNRDSVILGRNQNPYAECNLQMAEENGVKIARRMTGGGAVFHDLGNLNFTFLAPKQDYQKEDAFAVIQAALLELGVDVERSGRNDLLAGGYKFSGNAFYSNEAAALHHGTVLVHSDLDKMNLCLGASGGKMQRKGIASVRSRVVNLCALQPSLTVPAVKDSLKRAYRREMQKRHAIEGVEERVIGPKAAPLALREKYASKEWIFGGYGGQWERRARQGFPWGGVTILMNVEKQRIAALKLDSDALLQAPIGAIEKKLIGVRLDALGKAMEELKASFEDEAEKRLADDVMRWMRGLLEGEAANERGAWQGKGI